MKVQSVDFPVYKNISRINFTGMSRKYVQNDSFINAVPRNYKSNEINDYLKTSKNEVRNLKQTAKKHQRQCLNILRYGKMQEYSPLEDDNYKVTFSDINEKTKVPSSINIWGDGRLVQSYTIDMLEPAPCI